MLKIISSFRDPDTDPLFEYIRGKYSDKPITVFYERFPSSKEELELNPYNFLIILEPNEFFGLHTQAIYQQSLFSAIITWDQMVVDNCSNAVKFTFNGRVLDKEFCQEIEDKEKKFEVSFLCGNKNLVEGHKLRHRVYEIGSNIKIPKKWYYVLEDYDLTTNTRPGYADYTKDLSHIPKGVDIIGYGKRVLFKESMFNVVIENVKHKNWYNKIGDNFLSKTVPIYWGCDNIEEFGYDERGIITFKNEKELLEIINSLTPELYHQMKPYIDYNYEVAKLDDLEDRISEVFDSFTELNNI
jgi:hypothetical protein